MPRPAAAAMRPDRIPHLARRAPVLGDVPPGGRTRRGAQGRARADPAGRRPDQDHDDRRPHRAPRGGGARSDDATRDRGDRRGVAPAGLPRRVARRRPPRHRAVGGCGRRHDRARRGAPPRSGGAPLHGGARDRARADAQRLRARRRSAVVLLHAEARRAGAAAARGCLQDRCGGARGGGHDGDGL